MTTGSQRTGQISSATGNIGSLSNLNAVEEEAIQYAHGFWQLHRRNELREKPGQRRQRQLQVLVLQTLQRTERATDRVFQQTVLKCYCAAVRVVYLEALPKHGHVLLHQPLKHLLVNHRADLDQKLYPTLRPE